MSTTKKASLRDSTISSIGEFLYEEGFAKDEDTKIGLLEVINLIADYHEEGVPLFPEVLITNNLQFLKTIPNKEIVIGEQDVSVKEFRKAVKLCAPLATNGWIVFIEVIRGRIRYGITSAEMAETSPSIYRQLVGNLKVDLGDNSTIAYIRNVGQKTVELCGLKNKLIVSLTLSNTIDSQQDEISELCESICRDITSEYGESTRMFLEKIIDDAIKRGHGNLVAVVDDDEDAFEKVKQKIPGVDGVYLHEPIDFYGLVCEAEKERSNETSINLKSHAAVLKAMLNHDGITIMTTKARVIGYHLLIGDFRPPGDKNEGASRLKAFSSMTNCEVFSFCFFKSQDGSVKIWKKD